MKKIIMSAVIGGLFLSGSALAEVYSTNISLYKTDTAGKPYLVSETSAAVPDNGDKIPVSTVRNVPVKNNDGKVQGDLQEGVTSVNMLIKTKEDKLFYSFEYGFSHVNMLTEKQAFQDKFDMRQTMVVEPGKTYEFKQEPYLIKVKVDSIK